MEVRFLWLQDVVTRKRLELKEVCGKKNPADVLTKPVSHSVVRELFEHVQARFRGPPRNRRSGGGAGDSNPCRVPADDL